MRPLCSPSLLSSFLVLLLTSAETASVDSDKWPYDLPADVKYYPEHERLVRRNIEAHSRLRRDAQPTAVRKMSGDEGEMFFLDYWQLGQSSDEAWASESAFSDGSPDPDDNTVASVPAPLDHDRLAHRSNLSDPTPLQPFLLHSNATEQEHRWLWGRSRLSRRDFLCPLGTESCAGIGRPNSCCGAGETCVQVDDTGLGDVGCCPQGSNCGGELSSCDTAAGYQACPNSPNGGCCIPNYACLDVGCIVASTMTTTVTLPVVTVTTGRPSTTPTPPPPSTTQTQPLTCSPGFQSCPASLGGGCCPSDRGCGPTDCPPLSTAAPPVRPTGSTTITSPPPTSAAPTTTLPPISGCPGGFYMCSAFYIGGCCRVGRDCAETSCPRAESTTTVDANGVTVVAPVGDGPATTAGSCASGWFSCPADANGGCCPTDYACGTGAQCSATAGGGGAVEKVPASSASMHGVRGGVVCIIVGMLGLLLVL
ncbi:hypothetical protein P152DRAFT_456877 [Eremomyces bilateralis CBS 781.70]|uniref:GPI anchored protein n=1 Tax=Eremomyces bilateralis CBS 781.70 TaxID=1392243 RepID=A0A6G1G9E1_9PEZI|nr:uncharacterized protein P152DRAFT_456877 [Eremomyces bilateralis CBS 781.70]KAF1814602.1 hypothetical protein P152DRAFT_456877 [Eremomyces bilateralis CBS 781.70]